MMEAVLGPIPPQLASSAAEGVRDLFRRCVLIGGWHWGVVCEGAHPAPAGCGSC